MRKKIMILADRYSKAKIVELAVVSGLKPENVLKLRRMAANIEITIEIDEATGDSKIIELNGSRVMSEQSAETCIMSECGHWFGCDHKKPCVLDRV